MWIFLAIALLLAVAVPGFRKFLLVCVALLALVVGCQLLKNSIAPRRTPSPPTWYQPNAPR